LDCRASAVFTIDIDGAKQPDDGPRRPNSGEHRARMNNENRQVNRAAWCGVCIGEGDPRALQSQRPRCRMS
jgi:hypothetical protein